MDFLKAIELVLCNIAGLWNTITCLDFHFDYSTTIAKLWNVSFL